MTFTDTDAGPFWLDEASRVVEKYDTCLDGTSAREKTKAQILIDLRSIGVDATSRRFLKLEFAEMCTQNNNVINVTSQNMIQRWCGKPKVMLQILSERRCIDTNLVTQPSSCPYFCNEKT